MKKAVLLVMCALVVLVSAQSAMAAKVYKMKLHTVGSETHQAHQSLLDFKKYVEEQTKDGVQVTLHINAALGGAAHSPLLSRHWVGDFLCFVIRKRMHRQAVKWIRLN